MSGRIRSIKPELLEDAKTAGLSHLQFRLFVSMLLLADDYGNLRATPSLICGNAFWATKDSPEDIETATSELEEAGLIRTYEIRGQLYAHVCGWRKHQRVDKPGKPRVPAEDDPEARPARPWITYVVRLGDDGPIKIGKTIDVEARIAKLQAGCRDKLNVIRVIGKNIEAELRQRFEQYRKHGEWFEPAPELVEFFSKESFANHSRKLPESLAPDLRSPTTTSDHDRDARESREDSDQSREGAWQPEARQQPCPPESVEPGEAARPTRSESGYDLAKRLWLELWSGRYREAYQFALDYGPRSEDRMLQRFGSTAQDQKGHEPEEFLRHKFGSYLRDTSAWIVDNRHPLRGLERDWNKYGAPKPKQSERRITAAVAEKKPSEEELMAAAQQAKAKLGELVSIVATKKAAR